jgi:hypothetical protein
MIGRTIVTPALVCAGIVWSASVAVAVTTGRGLGQDGNISTGDAGRRLTHQPHAAGNRYMQARAGHAADLAEMAPRRVSSRRAVASSTQDDGELLNATAR